MVHIAVPLLVFLCGILVSSVIFFMENLSHLVTEFKLVSAEVASGFQRMIGLCARHVNNFIRQVAGVIRKIISTKI